MGIIVDNKFVVMSILPLDEAVKVRAIIKKYKTFFKKVLTCPFDLHFLTPMYVEPYTRLERHCHWWAENQEGEVTYR